MKKTSEYTEVRVLMVGDDGLFWNQVYELLGGWHEELCPTPLLSLLETTRVG